MALIPAKCTQCGANIEVDVSQEAGICKYCGTAFITEKAINNYNTYITNNNNFAGANINVVGGDVTNLLELAKNALEINNEDDILRYCEKALEINVKSAEAWFIKMQGEKIRAIKAPTTMENAKSIEAIFVAGNNSIKYETDNEKNARTKAVHKFYMESVKAFLSSMKVSVEYDDIQTIHALANINKTNALAKDQMFLLAITAKELFVLKLIEQISMEEFLSDIELQELLIECINLYVEFRNLYKDRTLIYSAGPNTEAAKTMKDKYDSLLKFLPADKQSKVLEWTLVGTDESPNTTSAGGCYVATCVYGSYDCSEVWVLRRFRDYTLHSTWYGRLFIQCYYAVSPTIVKWFGNTKWFKSFWRVRLDKMVNNLKRQGILDTPYNDKN